MTEARQASAWASWQVTAEVRRDRVSRLWRRPAFWIALACLPSLVLAGWLVVMLAREEERTAQVVARHAIETLDRTVFERYGDALAFAGMPEVRWMDQSSLPSLLDHLVLTYAPYYRLALVADRQGRILAVNRVDQAGRPVPSAPLVGRIVANEPWFQRAVRADRPVSVEDFHQDPLVQAVYRTAEPVMSFSAPIRDANGALVGVWSTRMAVEPLADLLARLARDYSAETPVPMIVTDRQQRHLIEAGPPVAPSTTALALASSTGYSHYPGLGWQVLAYRPASVAEIIWVRLWLVGLLGLVAVGAAIGMWQAVVADRKARERAAAALERAAHYDALTGLPNRVLFDDRMTLALNRARRLRQPLAVMVLDLDRFKLVNDTLGHASGDQLLRAVAERLVRCLRDSDTVARVGGDEFFLILPGVSQAEDAVTVARKLLDALVPPIVVNGQELHVSASIGISLYPDDGEDAESLLQRADLAMYRAKEEGSGYALHAATMDERVAKRLALEQELRRALERGEFLLQYQPLVNVDTGAVTGLEALIRWRHPDCGLIPPAEFIPVAEATGLIVPIGEWVLRAACSQAQAWRGLGLLPGRLAVNISARQFAQPGIVRLIEQVLHETALPPSGLDLELTEGLLHNAEETMEKLQALRKLGVRLSIDDFGTGYSSLGYLRRLPIQTLKVDRSFLSEDPTESNHWAILKAIVSLGRSLNLHVVAEGVETAAQLALLREIGCEEAQGFLISRPLSAEEMGTWLRRRSQNRRVIPGSQVRRGGAGPSRQLVQVVPG